MTNPLTTTMTFRRVKKVCGNNIKIGTLPCPYSFLADKGNVQ
jgi:hypothetical protein